jgi:RimJ/RimL family protein N-acetyltransferase
MVLHADDLVRAVLTPSVAETLGLSPARETVTESDFRQALSGAGMALHGADNLFYFTESDKEALLRETAKSDVRRLTQDDAAAFTEFESSASEQDLDAAYVELDHWAVFGAFAQGRLVCAASMYPWGNARIADLGILTLPEFRGRGHARAVVRALCRHAADQGYQPQYRCQLDNEASAALAASSGLTHFGTWEVVSSGAGGD